MKDKIRLSRRTFLSTAAMGLAGTAVSAREKKADEEAQLKIKEYRILGRTRFRVSDLALGYVQDESLMAAMLDAGINYIDTAESYPGHHKIVGRVIKDRDRNSFFLTSKMLIQGDTSKQGFIKRARKALEELGTDRIDCMMMHMPERMELLGHPEFHAAMKQLKAEGRIRHVGVSHHGSFWYRDPEQAMARVLLAAAEDGRFDVFLFAHNFLQMDESDKVLRACREKKIGTVLMKTTPVAKYYMLKERIAQMEKEGRKIHPLIKKSLGRFKEKADRAQKFIKEHNLQNPEEIRKAAIRFVLSNPDVNTVCCSLRTFEEMKQILPLSGTRLSSTDKALLSAYTRACGDLYCRHGCGRCEPSCPKGVPVNTIMRYAHYFMAQGREREAMEHYSRIPGARADTCATCPGFCEKACPYSVPIQGMLFLAHDRLALA